MWEKKTRLHRIKSVWMAVNSFTSKSWRAMLLRWGVRGQRKEKLLEESRREKEKTLDISKGNVGVCNAVVEQGDESCLRIWTSENCNWGNSIPFKTQMLLTKQFWFTFQKGRGIKREMCFVRWWFQTRTFCFRNIAIAPIGYRFQNCVSFRSFCLHRYSFLLKWKKSEETNLFKWKWDWRH